MGKEIIKDLTERFSNVESYKQWPGLIKAYKKWLPVSDKTPIVTLQEGATPLIELESVNKIIGKGIKVYAKLYSKDY